eukprot:1155262-Pelagomonas_calceolata.AAC.2
MASAAAAAAAAAAFTDISAPGCPDRVCSTAAAHLQHQAGVTIPNQTKCGEMLKTSYNAKLNAKCPY